ncbi:MAG: molybdopterin molybdotransferase MoeA [Dehalococcoidia bacterium]
MISVEEALEKILAAVSRLEREEKHILECLDQVLDEDVFSGFDIPPLDNAAMDGYAVRSQDLAAASKERLVYLDVIGEVAAGHVSTQNVAEGKAVRIMTGAPVPGGADAVVRFEDTDEQEHKGDGKSHGKIGIFVTAGKGQNIRNRGEDIRSGTIVLKKGTVLGPAEIGVLASLGKSRAAVIRRPVISILSTGDELCKIEQHLSPGKIYDSNSYTIAASVLRCGGIPKLLDIARDSIKPLKAQISDGAEADMLITSGGVSMGDYDIVKDVLSQMGQIDFWTVRMKPGKPLAFGQIKKQKGKVIREVPHLGLPGNPVSSMITFEQFARPAILKMMGKDDFARPTVMATMDQSIKNNDGRRIFARVRLTQNADGWHASLTGPQGSGILTSMSAANGLAIVPEDCPLVRAGEKIKVQLLEGGQCPA